MFASVAASADAAGTGRACEQPRVCAGRERSASLAAQRLRSRVSVRVGDCVGQSAPPEKSGGPCMSLVKVRRLHRAVSCLAAATDTLDRSGLPPRRPARSLQSAPARLASPVCATNAPRRERRCQSEWQRHRGPCVREHGAPGHNGSNTSQPSACLQCTAPHGQRKQLRSATSRGAREKQPRRANTTQFTPLLTALSGAKAQGVGRGAVASASTASTGRTRLGLV
jgi:hypothetical protein